MVNSFLVLSIEWFRSEVGGGGEGGVRRAKFICLKGTIFDGKMT